MLNIIIETDFDFTPMGKRAARYVATRAGAQLRWYVAGRLWRKGAPLALTDEWLVGENGPRHCPQPWSAF